MLLEDCKHLTRLALLLVGAALGVTLIRNDLSHAADSGWDFLSDWFAHTFCLLLLLPLAIASIIRFHKFFVGHPKAALEDSYHEVAFYVLMTVLVATLGVFMLMHIGTFEEY